MTSSYMLNQRRKMLQYDKSNFTTPHLDSLGGTEDAYIINSAHRECRSGFQAIPIGNPYGFAICKRMTGPCGTDAADFGTSAAKEAPVVRHEQNVEKFQGDSKFSADLYNPWYKRQVQMYNPDYYNERFKIPEFEYAVLNDYYDRRFEYNGTGISPKHQIMVEPGTGNPLAPQPKDYQYAFARTNNPPPKYDPSRLQQPYPVWKSEQQFYGLKTEEELQNMDLNHNKYFGWV